MKVTAESTEKLVTLVNLTGNARGEIPARIWKAKTEGGVECYLFVTRVMVAEGQDLSQFNRDLHEERAPISDPAIEAIPLRLIL